MNNNDRQEIISSGVDSLIKRLRDEGTSAGKQEAEKIVAAAEAKAQAILEKANAEARATVVAARKEADELKNAGADALKVAMRDTVLDMKMTLMQRFSSDVERLVSRHLQDKDVLRQMVIEVAGRVADDARLGEDEPIEFVLPQEVVGLEELRQDPEELEHGKLTALALGLTVDLLRDGVTFSVGNDDQSGMRVRLVGNDITLDLTDQAVANLLLQHLQPRFRSILDGVVK